MPPVFHLLEKELLQHKIITRLPLFVFIFSLLLIALFIYGFDAEVNFSLSGFNNGDALNVQQGLTNVISFAASLVSYLLSILYLSKAICKDREDGTIAFWRSMPVSDLLSQLVKLCIGLIVIPLICSLLVLSAELFLWLLSALSPQQVKYLIGDISFFSVIQNYIGFLLHMLMVATALLPFACLIFAISQIFNSPLLIAIVGIYALKIASSIVLPSSHLEMFFYQFIDLPTKLIFTVEPMQVINEVTTVNAIAMYITALCLFIFSLKIQKHNELRLGKLVINNN